MYECIDLNNIINILHRTGIPHEFYSRLAREEFNVELPAVGEYAVGNIFFNPDVTIRQATKQT